MGEKFSVGRAEPEVNAFAEFFPEDSEQNEALRYETISELIEVFGDQQFQYGSHTGTVSTIVEVCPHIKAMLDRGVSAGEIAAEVAPYAVEEIQVEQPVEEPKTVEPEVVAVETVNDSRATETVADKSQAVESAPSKSEATDKSVDRFDSDNDVQKQADISPQQDKTESPTQADQSKSAEVSIDIPSNSADASAAETIAASVDTSDSKSEVRSVVDAANDRGAAEAVAAAETIGHDSAADSGDGEVRPVVEKSEPVIVDKHIQVEQFPVRDSSTEKSDKTIADDLEIEATRSIEVTVTEAESAPLAEDIVAVEKAETGPTPPQPKELITPTETMPIDRVDDEEGAVEVIAETDTPDLARESQAIELSDDSIKPVQGLEFESEIETNETDADFVHEDLAVDLPGEDLDYDELQTEESSIEQVADYEHDSLLETDIELGVDTLPVDVESEFDHEAELSELELAELDEAQDEPFYEVEANTLEEDSETLSALEFGGEAGEPEHTSELHDFIDSEPEEVELAPLPVVEISQEVTDILDITLDQEAEYVPEVFYASIKKLEHNMSILKQATSAEECSDALEAIHDSLIEILDALGCYDSEVTAKYLLEHHTLSELHELLIRLQRELSEKNKLKPITKSAAGVALTLGRYVISSYRKAWAS